MNAPPNRAYILRLPDELLENILRYACSFLDGTIYERSYGQRPETRYYTLASWSLICRRLYPIVTSFLYADLLIACSTPGVQHESVSKLLHRSCRQNPALWDLCQRLIVHYRDSGVIPCEKQRNPLYYIANDFTTWFTAAKSFALFGLGRDERAWQLLRQGLCRFRSLMELSLIYGINYDMDLWRVVDTVSELACPELRTLALRGVSTGSSMERAMSQRKPRTGQIRILKLRCFLGTPADLEELVKWPLVLEEFHLEFTFGDDYGESGKYSHWSLATLQPILAINKSTLRSIKIRAINVGGLTGFDMREFERLEELSLSSATICRKYKHWESEDHSLSVLLGPRLYAFELDMTLEDQQHCESLDDFGEIEENWLRALGHLAVRQRRPLREIRIQFAPYAHVSSGFHDRYPWDRMDDLDRELRPNGIRVRYTPPTLSREQFEKSIRDRFTAESC
ncbi:hypothetical protein BDW75DRAFT_88463 [Aspergillus navahoensis]